MKLSILSVKLLIVGNCDMSDSFPKSCFDCGQSGQKLPGSAGIPLLPSQQEGSL